MGFEVAKCNVVCDKMDTCGYAQSKQNVFYNFKHVCKNQSMYFEHYEGDFRDTPKEEEIKIEEINTIECSSNGGQDHVCEHAEESIGSEG